MLLYLFIDDSKCKLILHVLLLFLHMVPHNGQMILCFSRLRTNEWQLLSVLLHKIKKKNSLLKCHLLLFLIMGPDTKNVLVTLKMPFSASQPFLHHYCLLALNSMMRVQFKVQESTYLRQSLTIWQLLP